MTRIVIVNADDFGQTAGVNRGVVEAHELGIVTSASMLVYHEAADEAARYVRELRAFFRLRFSLHAVNQPGNPAQTGTGNAEQYDGHDQPRLIEAEENSFPLWHGEFLCCM